MTMMTDTLPSRPTWLGRAERWLDDRGKGAWIAAMIVGFIAFWPIGLALLAYMIWSNRMFKELAGASALAPPAPATPAPPSSRPATAPSTAYKAETLRRLEEEQDAFEVFLQRLREAKDKAEFDQFMADRGRAAATADANRPDATQSGGPRRAAPSTYKETA